MNLPAWWPVAAMAAMLVAASCAWLWLWATNQPEIRKAATMKQTNDLITQDHVSGDFLWRVVYECPLFSTRLRLVEMVASALDQLTKQVNNGTTAGVPTHYVLNGLAKIVTVRSVTMQRAGSWSDTAVVEDVAAEQ